MFKALARRREAALDLEFAQRAEDRLADRLARVTGPATAELVVSMILNERDKQADALERLGRSRKAAALRADTAWRREAVKA